MKKMNKKNVWLLIIAVTILALGVLFVYAKSSNKCVDIIGDGYDMGTDPEPVVIGNTCSE